MGKLFLKYRNIYNCDLFSKNWSIRNKPNKISYIQYVITPKGISERTKLTLNFMKRKMSEYDELKKELSKDRE